MSFSYVNGNTHNTAPGNVTSFGFGAPPLVVGNLVIVSTGLVNPGGNSYAISDSSGKNTWHSTPVVGTGVGASFLSWTVLQPGGGGSSVTITITSTSADYFGCILDQFSFASGYTVSLGTIASQYIVFPNDNTNPNNENFPACSFSGGGNWLLYAQSSCDSTNNGFNTYPTANSPFTQGGYILGAGGDNYINGTGYYDNLLQASSPITAAFSYPSVSAGHFSQQVIPFLEVYSATGGNPAALLPAM